MGTVLETAFDNGISTGRTQHHGTVIKEGARKSCAQHQVFYFSRTTIKKDTFFPSSKPVLYHFLRSQFAFEGRQYNFSKIKNCTFLISKYIPHYKISGKSRGIIRTMVCLAVWFSVPGGPEIHRDPLVSAPQVPGLGVCTTMFSSLML